MKFVALLFVFYSSTSPCGTPISFLPVFLFKLFSFSRIFYKKQYFIHFPTWDQLRNNLLHTTHLIYPFKKKNKLKLLKLYVHPNTFSYSNLSNTYADRERYQPLISASYPFTFSQSTSENVCFQSNNNRVGKLPNMLFYNNTCDWFREIR